MATGLTKIISIPAREGTIFKESKRIIRIQASSNYSRIYCTDERYPITVAKVLQWFQNKLPRQDFIRTHRAHLVNKQFIESKTLKQVLLQNGETINISKRKRNEIKNIA